MVVDGIGRQPVSYLSPIIREHAIVHFNNTLEVFLFVEIFHLRCCLLQMVSQKSWYDSLLSDISIRWERDYALFCNFVQ
jgi:hypothetical protein